MKFVLSLLCLAAANARVEEKNAAGALRNGGSMNIRAPLQVQVQSRELQEGCEACEEGSVVEFHFSPTEATWEAHVALARLKGCELASIKSEAEQAAAVATLEPFIGFPYKYTDNFQGSFVYIGGQVVTGPDASGAYVFEWVDGSGQFTVAPGGNTLDPYTNFIPGDPNGNTGIFTEEKYIALSLDENGSTGIARGEWVDFSSRKSPALYKCCVPTQAPDFSTCKVSSSPEDSVF